MRRGNLLEQTRRYYGRQRYLVSVDSQSSFTLAGCPGLVAVLDDEMVVIVVNAARPSAVHTTQVMTYTCAQPRALPRQFSHACLSGQVAYSDGPVDVPGGAVD